MELSKGPESAKTSSAPAAAPSPPPDDVKVDISNPIFETILDIKEVESRVQCTAPASNIGSTPSSIERQVTVKQLEVAADQNGASVTAAPAKDDLCKQPDIITSSAVPTAQVASSPPLSIVKEDRQSDGPPVDSQQKRVLWIETDKPADSNVGRKVYGEDLGSPLSDGGGGAQFWADLSKSVASPTSTDGVKSPIRRRLLAGYSKDNILRKGYKYLVGCATLLFAVLCWIGDSRLRPQETQIEDFLYRMLAFASATVCAATALQCYLAVLEVKHGEKLASALCASALAALSMATHWVIGFQAVPLIQNYAGRTVHVVRWVEQVTETFILISVVEALNWRMRRSIVNISFQVGAQLILGFSTLQAKLPLGVGSLVVGLGLYAQIFYLWRDTRKRHRANKSKPQKERDQNLKQAWGLLNTYFVSTNGFLVILILGLLGLYTSVHEAMLYSALDMITKMIYGVILVRR